MAQPGPTQPQGQWPNQPTYGAQPQPQHRGMSRGAKAAVWVAGSLAGLVVLSIVAAVVLPLYLNHRARVEATHISVRLPDTINGMNRSSNISGSAMQSAIAGLPMDLSSSTYGAVYTDGRGAGVTVIAGHHL